MVAREAFGASSVIVAELATLLVDMQLDPPDTARGLAEVIENARRCVPGVKYAGITVASRSCGITSAAATHRYPVLLDKIQQQHQEGPCLSAAWEHHVVHIDDLSFERRWPKYREDVLTQTPIRCVLLFELSVDQDALTALNFYADRPHAFDDESVELGTVFATHTALAWKTLRRDGQLRSALATRDVVGQAKGILMERFDIDAVQAFDLLNRFSQETRTKVVDVAERLLADEHPPRPCI
jgi:hypothetical protein